MKCSITGLLLTVFSFNNCTKNKEKANPCFELTTYQTSALSRLSKFTICVRTIFAHLFASLMLCLGWLNSFSLPKSSKCKQNLLINASYAQLWTTQLSISNIIGVANRISVSLGRYWDCGANYFSLMKDILTLSLQAINIDLLKKTDIQAYKMVSFHGHLAINIDLRFKKDIQ